MNLMMRKITLCSALLLLLTFASSFPALALHVMEDSYEPFVPDYNVPYDPIEISLSSAAQDTLPEFSTPIHYEVSSGDTLFRIAKSFGVSVQNLMAFNGMDNPNRLSVGQRLEIPPDFAGIDLDNAGGGVILQVLQTTLTAYTAGLESTGKTKASPAYGITSSGSKAAEGRTIAVDPSLIPIGSTVFIDGVGIRKAEDTGSAIRGARIDLFMNDLSEARKFGVKKNVKVYVLADSAA